MNKNILMIVGGAFATAMVVAMVVQSRVSDDPSAPQDMVEILVANKKLRMGERVKAEDVRWQSWSKDGLFSGVIERSEQKDEENLIVYDAPLRRTVESGEPVTMQTVISDVKNGNSFLAATMSPGMRAMAIAVKEATSVGGFIAPGDYVDVIVSYSPRMNRELQKHASDIIQRYASQTVLSNIRVLAVDQDAKEEEREAKKAKTVTLEVTKEGAEKLALAEAMGSLSLTLRRLGEEDTEDDKKPSLMTDVIMSTAIKKVKRVKQGAETSSNAVRLYSGTQIQNIPVRVPVED